MKTLKSILKSILYGFLSVGFALVIMATVISAVKETISSTGYFAVLWFVASVVLLFGTSGFLWYIGEALQEFGEDEKKVGD